MLCVVRTNSILSPLPIGILSPGFRAMILFGMLILLSRSSERRTAAENGVQIIGALYFGAVYGAAPMWSRWACVTTIALTFALQSFIVWSSGTASTLFSVCSSIPVSSSASSVSLM